MTYLGAAFQAGTALLSYGTARSEIQLFHVSAAVAYCIGTMC